RLDTREALLKGGRSGAVATPGQPDSSLLIKAVGYRDDELKMPPQGKLSDRQIADLTRWIQMGVPFPPRAATSKAPSRRDHCAFRGRGDRALPAVKNVAWPQAPLDRFVLAALEARGLQPAPPADRHTLLRRATFDLTGLPPTPAELEDFLADNSPGAF